jgi:hypothetical protein
MATYKTGRQRTITFSGSIGGGIYYVLRSILNQGGSVYRQTDASISISFGPGYPNLPSLTAFANANPTGTNLPPWHPSWQCTVNTGIGGSNTALNTQTINSSFLYYWFGNPVYGADWSQDISGTWSISMDVEEYVSIGVGDFPSYGGIQVFDPPGETSLTFFEALRPGGVISVTLNCGGANASRTDTIGAGQAYVIPYMLYLVAYSRTSGAYHPGERNQPDGTPFEVPAGNANTTSITSFFQGVGMGAVYTRSTTGASVNAASGAAAHTDQPPDLGQPGGPNGGTYSAYCFANIAPVKSWSLSGIVKAMDADYPSNVTLVVEGVGVGSAILTASGGIFSGSYNQRNFNCSSILNGANQTQTNVNEWQFARVHVQTAWLTGNGENREDWRVLMRGHLYDSFTLAQSATLVADDGTSLTPTDPVGSWAGTGLDSLTVSGGIQAAVGAGGPGTLTRTYGNYSSSHRGGSFQGYRYLTIRVQADADNQPFSVTITTPASADPGPGVVTSRTWTRDKDGNALQAGTIAADITLDLCAPTSMTARTDDKDSVWPVHDNGDGRHFTEDTEMWGVTNVLTVAFTGLAASHVYTIVSMTLERLDHSRVDFTPVYNNWVKSDAEVPTSDDYRDRFILGETDGRQSLQKVDFTRSTANVPTTYTTFLISDIIDSINGNSGAYPTNGWSATPATFDTSNCGDPTPPLHCLLNNAVPGIWIWGGGMYYDGSWHLGLAQDAATGLNVPAQVLADSVDFPPEAGDLFHFSTGNWGGGAVLVAAKMFRGDAWGIILNNDVSPDSAKEVDLKVVADNSLAGTGTTDTRGEYLTGSPYAKGEASCSVVPQDGPTPYPSIGITAKARKRTRACFRIDANAQTITPLFALHDYTHRLLVFGKDADGHLAVLLYDDLEVSAVLTIIDGSTPCGYPSAWLRDTVIECIYLRDTAPYLARSRTHGRTWTLISVPGTYDAVTSTRHQNRIILLGWKGDPTNQWYVRVGTLQPNDTYSWSGEVSLALTSPNGSGHVITRYDGVVEFVWEDTSNSVFILRGRGIGSDGSGTWT